MDNYIRKILILQFTKTNLMKKLIELIVENIKVRVHFKSVENGKEYFDSDKMKIKHINSFIDFMNKGNLITTIKHITVFSILIFLFACKKEVVIPPVIIKNDSVSVRFITGGGCQYNWTFLTINNNMFDVKYHIDTTIKLLKGDSVSLTSMKISHFNCTSENWVKLISTETLIDSSETTINGSSEQYYSARLEYIIK